MLQLVADEDLKAIAAALTGSDLVVVSDDGTKIRRNPAKPLPSDSLFNKRAICRWPATEVPSVLSISYNRAIFMRVPLLPTILKMPFYA